jgi:tripartite-type tricarboxylate transporter receptor subunit TctC
MKALSRGVAALVVACTAVAITTAAARAADDDYPNHPVRWLVGYPPGGSTDICARLIGQYLSEHLHQQFAVENKPGAGNNLAPRLRPTRRPTAIPYSWSTRRMPSTPVSTRTCHSISSAT